MEHAEKDSLPRTAMVFGVFDGIHDGHRHLLKRAEKVGQEMVVVVAPDKAVRSLKGRQPSQSFQERMGALKNEYPEATVIEGDTEQGSWEVIKRYKPQVICLGYDQKFLEDELRVTLPKMHPDTTLVIIPPYQPEKNHSRFNTSSRSLPRMTGKIIHTSTEETDIGFSTTNLSLYTEHPSGTYKGTVYLFGIDYNATLCIDEDRRTLAAHIIGINSVVDCHGRWAVVEVGKKIRNATSSTNCNNVREQITKM